MISVNHQGVGMFVGHVSSLGGPLKILSLIFGKFCERSHRLSIKRNVQRWIDINRLSARCRRG